MKCRYEFQQNPKKIFVHLWFVSDFAKNHKILLDAEKEFSASLF